MCIMSFVIIWQLVLHFSPRVQEFCFHGKSRGKEEEKQRIMDDIASDEKQLKERRWPGTMSRSEPKVEAEPPKPKPRSLKGIL